MKFTYYGHACFAVDMSGKHLLFDPCISPNPLAQHIDVDTIPADYIFISHGHEDHIADVIRIAQRTNATLIGGVEVLHWFKQKGLHQMHEMNFGTTQFDFAQVSFVPAAHSSAMPDGTYGGQPGGFVLANLDTQFYYAGDTSLSMEMQLIPHYAQLDFAVLPIGGNYTMNARDAVRCAQMIDCNKIIGVHYNTFKPISIDLDEAKSLFRMAEKELLLPTIGETLLF